MKRLLAFYVALGILFTACNSSDSSPFSVYNAAVSKLSKAKTVQSQEMFKITVAEESGSDNEESGLTREISAEGSLSKSRNKFAADLKYTIFGKGMETLAYYNDGNMYLNSLGEKLKKKQDFKESLVQIGITDFISFTKADIISASDEKDGDFKLLKFEIDGEKISEVLLAEIGEFSQNMGIFSEISFSPVTLLASIDDDGSLVRYAIAFTITGIDDEQAVPIDYVIEKRDIQILDSDISFPDDLKSYEEYFGEDNLDNTEGANVSTENE